MPFLQQRREISQRYGMDFVTKIEEKGSPAENLKILAGISKDLGITCKKKVLKDPCTIFIKSLRILECPFMILAKIFLVRFL